jgi:glycosyltransferase involved in cell wall biosynthesis
MTPKNQPMVTVIIPCRNEADFIKKCVRSILDCDYDREMLEVIVVDGISTDGTREVIEQISGEDDRLLLLDNPRKIVPTAMNIGIKRARGEIIIRVDGHAEVSRSFVRQSVDILTSKAELWCVGGPIETISTTYVGRAIAAAMSSPVGVGNAMFRLGNYEGYVDTLAFGAYRRWVFDKIGLFDEELLRNQDDDLNLRLIMNGGKIFMTPKIKSRYYSRTSLGKLWRQYFQYGFWRIRTLQKHKRAATLRQIVPLLFVSSLIVLAVGGIVSKIFWCIFAATLLLYALALVYGSIDVGKQAGWKYALLAPVVFAILHFGYGFGCLWGIVRFVLLRGKFMTKPSDAKLSR